MDGTLVTATVIVVEVVGLAVVRIFAHAGALHVVKQSCGSVDVRGVFEKKDGVYDYGWRKTERVRLSLYRK